MNLSFGHNPWLFALLLLLAGGVSWWTYRRTIPDIKPLLKWFLGVLRAVSLALILFLLFEPVLQRSEDVEREPIVAVLVDNSESMALSDSLIAENAPHLDNKLRELAQSMGAVETRFYSFGGNVARVDSLESFLFNQGKTDISAAIESIHAELQNESLKAIILVSDGLYNSGTNPLHIAERSTVPIFSVAHGDSTIQRDIRLVQVLSNELTYAGSTVPVMARIRNDGYTSGELVVSLVSAGSVISRQVVELPRSGSETEVELSFDAVDIGRNSLSVSVNRFDEEATYRNNSQAISILVLDQKKKVLLLAGAPSPDVSNLARILDSDETAEVVLRTQGPDGSFYEDEFPSDLTEFDLVISIGFPGKATPPSISASVADVVASGTSLLFMLDRGTELGAIQRDFNRVLPATLRTPRPTFIEGSLDVSAAAEGHAIFDTGIRNDNATWNRLPPLMLSESRWEALPSATVLATSEIRGVPLGDPLFVVSRIGGTKSAALLAHGFWKWTNTPEDLETESRVFQSVLNNTLQWLYATDDNRLVRVEPSDTEYAEGESVILNGEVYDETLRPVSDASLSLTVTAPDGQLFPFEMNAAGTGRYTLDVGSLPAGSYEYSASATRNDLEIGTDTGYFTIGTRTLEFRNTKADFALMAQLAVRSGGELLNSDELNDALQVIRSSVNMETEHVPSITQSRLWQKVPFLFLILALLTLEWFFRKRFGMV